MGCGKDSVSSLILGFCIHFPLCLEGFSPRSCSVSWEENCMALRLLPLPMSREPGRSVSQQSWSCAFSIPRGPGGGVPAHIKDLMGRPWSPCWPSHGCVHVTQGSSERSVLQVDGEVQVGWGGMGSQTFI